MGPGSQLSQHQYFFDKTGYRMDIDGRRQYRDNDGIRLSHVVGQIGTADAGRGVDDDSVHFFGHAHLPAARDGHVFLVRLNTMNTRHVRRSSAQPVQRRPLRVVVQQGGKTPPGGVTRGQISGNSRFSAAAFGI